ncbi:MAG: multiprotein-bridging factor 1 family protein [Haloferacaceae archaeon]
MAKYSTGGGGGGDDGGSCELCGRETSDLRRASVAGADLLVCAECAPHGESDSRGGSAGGDSSGGGSSSGPRAGSDGRRTARNAARMYDAGRGDSTHWEEEGTDYEEDRLPYLVSDYGERVERGRREAGLTAAELADEVDADEEEVLAVEQGRAARAGVGGSTVRALEERLDVRLVEET